METQESNKTMYEMMLRRGMKGIKKTWISNIALKYN